MTMQDTFTIQELQREVESGCSLYCKPIKRDTLRRLLRLMPPPVLQETELHAERHAQGVPGARLP